MAQLKDLLVTGDSRVVGNNYNNNPKIAFGTCSTAAGTAEKVVVVDDPTWNLQIGDIVGVKFTNSNTAGTVKLNVNNSGAIQVSYNTSRPYTGSDQMITGYANRTILYQYDGTYWHWVFDTVNRNDNTYTTAKSWTAAGTAAKTATCHDYVAAANSWNIVQMCYANTSASALTLNINSQGAKSIYINGSASSSTNYTLPAGHYLVFYDGTNYYFRTDGKLTASITGDAATVNGKTVGVNVPADAKFTDTTYESKAAASGGTAVSLVTTGEKYTWNNKGSGTITGVSVNGTSVATSGTANITSVPASILTGAIPSAITATTQSSGDNSTKIATTAYVDGAITALPEPMIFKGSLGTGGTITSLPTATASNEGFTYKVITAGTYASQAAKVGDTFISDGSAWILIPSGDEPSGTVTSVKIQATSPIAIDSSDAITTSGTRTLSHANSGVSAGTYRSVTVNATGHVTAGTNPTTLSGYGITDAKINNGVITLGSNTITPLTSSSTLDATKLSGTIPSGCYTDTKNTAGSTDTSSKIFLIGATSQAANPQTYSDNEVYATSGVLTTKSVQVGGTAATMQYNSTDKCIEFVFS